MPTHKINCTFCGSSNTLLLYKHKYHPYITQHGPIDFYKCKYCKSGFTYPLPTSTSLANLYASFCDGLNPNTKKMRLESSFDKWFNQCINNALNYSQKKYTSKDYFTWIDIGAGGGELSKLMSKKFPRSKGVAIDFHPRPKFLDDCKNLEWLQVDLNKKGFGSIFRSKFDLVFSITVIEHILIPNVFISDCLSIMKNTGTFYITAPAFGSLASRILKGRWSYLIFGEHINIPSKRGIILLMSQEANNKQFNKPIIFSRSIILPYPLVYYLKHFGLNNIANFFSEKICLSLPTGILEAGVCFKNEPLTSR
ncbi:class I SAM-dependent methyltransferase [Danxiaibacter flavus]|uniref:Class I SAM-dependent methyltransferase n=1 Tax=Danxiaibacter flavus TaxID=3049108 RepID=A0ABV3Z9M7_9BACT|nr:class I SAM-dependent methyltransferase [Chitinophagaceae bacterium DXS]